MLKACGSKFLALVIQQSRAYKCAHRERLGVSLHRWLLRVTEMFPKGRKESSVLGPLRVILRNLSKQPL